jgi:pimeloyl-ACP methyl ester carboxylesterase
MRMPRVEAALTTVYVEPVGTGESGRLPDHPRGYTLDRYCQSLHGIIEHLGIPTVHLLGHSHGSFVAQRYALAHPDRLAGMILYSSALAAGPELFAVATRNVEAFVRDHEGRPETSEILQTWASIGSIADDAGYTAVLQRLLPLYSPITGAGRVNWRHCAPACAPFTSLAARALRQPGRTRIDRRADACGRGKPRLHLRGSLGAGTGAGNPSGEARHSRKERAFWPYGGSRPLRACRFGFREFDCRPERGSAPV